MKDLIERIQKELPDPEEVVSRVQRELPDTDRDRYDIAYQRGRAQARSTLLAGGLALGSAVGAGLMWLFDPERGNARRAALTQRMTGIKNDLARTASGRAEDLQNRAQGFAIEKGIKEPPAESSDERVGTPVMATTATAATAATDYGQGYREGFGQTEHDPTAPGSQVAEPLAPAEVGRFGSSGPVAGATATIDEEATTGRLPDR